MNDEPLTVKDVLPMHAVRDTVIVVRMSREVDAVETRALMDRFDTALRAALAQPEQLVEYFGRCDCGKQVRLGAPVVLTSAHPPAQAVPEGLLEAVKWVLRDASYKAPEQVGETPMRWIDRLSAALAAAPKPFLSKEFVSKATNQDGPDVIGTDLAPKSEGGE